MLNCKEVSHLVSDSLDSTQSLYTKLKLYFHFAMCGICYRYKKQISLIRRALTMYSRDIHTSADYASLEMPEDSKQRIKEHLTRHFPPGT